MDRRFSVGGQEFRFAPPGVKRIEPEDGDTSMFVFKSAAMLEQYRVWAERYHGGRVVELGIYDGGSTALLAKMIEPSRLAAFDIKDDVPELTHFVEANGLGGQVFANFGQDQADLETLESRLDSQMGLEPLDLVIDDASHLYRESKASFSVLFPRLRPGGLFVLEDWAHEHLSASRMDEMIKNDPDGRVAAAITQALVADQFQAGDPLAPTMARMVLELVLVAGVHPELISSIRIDRDFAEIERGPAKLSGRFMIDDHLAPIPMFRDLSS